MPSQTKRATLGFSTNISGNYWIAPQAVAYNDGMTFARYNAIPSANLTATLVSYGFGFSLPLTAVITGLITSFQRQIIVPSASTSGSQLPYLPTGGAALSPMYTYLPSVTPVVYTTSVQLSTGSGIGINYNSMNQWGADLAVDLAGGETFTWNVNLTPELINQSGFGFGIAARVDTDPAILLAQNFCMTVFYS